MIFVIAASTLITLCLAFLIIPQLTKKKSDMLRQDYDLEIFKDQLREIDRDIENSRLEESQAHEVRLEVQKRILATRVSEEEYSFPSLFSSYKVWYLPTFLIFGFFVVAPLLYNSIGSPGQPGQPFAERNIKNTLGEITKNKNMPSTEPKIIVELEKQLKDDPRKTDAWIAIGKAYAAAKNYQSASRAYKTAVELTDRDPLLLADWAEIRLMRNKGVFNEKIHNDFMESFGRNPKLLKPWFYLGVDRLQKGNFRAAVKLWKSLIALSEPLAPYLDDLKKQITRAAKDGDFDPNSVKISNVAQSILRNREQSSLSKDSKHINPMAKRKTLPSLSNEEVEAAREMSTEERNLMIRSMVRRLADRLKANPNDPSGWRRLAHAYEVLGEKEKAKDARKRANEAEQKN